MRVDWVGSCISLEMTGGIMDAILSPKATSYFLLVGSFVIFPLFLSKSLSKLHSSSFSFNVGLAYDFAYDLVIYISSIGGHIVCFI